MVETPALLPVINPNRKLLGATEMRRLFGTQMVITNSYIISRTEGLRERAVREGVHGILGYDGPVMTDSGTFQTHVYSDVSVDPAGIVAFQKSIGSDVATVFDVFSEPDFTREKAAEAVATTSARVAKAASAGGGGSLIAATVQGGIYPDLREQAAREISSTGADYFSIGGVVPLMEGHRFGELADVIVASKKGLAPGRPVHLFGAGHPQMLPLAVLLGCDIFDSASYVKYAYDGRMMFPEGSFNLAEIRHSWCTCPVCTSATADELRGMEADERVLNLAKHNLYTLSSEIARIRQAIHDGSLWNLVESRARGDPQLFDAFARVLSHRRYLERFEPLSRKSGIGFVDSLTASRPDASRFAERAGAVRPGSGDKVAIITGERQYFTHFDSTSRAPDEDAASLTPLGIFPLALTETYPLSQSSYSASVRAAEKPGEYAARFDYSAVRTVEGKWRRNGRQQARESSADQARAVCEYQFGPGAARALLAGRMEYARSRNTGKLRGISSEGRQILFFRTEDGLFSLKFHGGEILHGALPPPAMRVVCLPDAVPFVSSGRSLFTRFVAEADDGILPGNECIVVDGNDTLLAVGRALLRREEMLSFGKGVAVDIREGRNSSLSSQQPEGMK